MEAEHGGVGERRAAWRIITSFELASGRRADEFETAVIINIDALSEVIAALEKGMTGGSFLQGGVGAALRRAVMNSEKVSGSDRSSVPLLSGGTYDGDRYGPQSGGDCRYLEAVDGRNEDQSSESREGQDWGNFGGSVRERVGFDHAFDQQVADGDEPRVVLR